MTAQENAGFNTQAKNQTRKTLPTQRPHSSSFIIWYRIPQCNCTQQFNVPVTENFRDHKISGLIRKTKLESKTNPGYYHHATQRTSPKSNDVQSINQRKYSRAIKN